MRILPVPFDLCCTCKPITECHGRSGWTAKVPAVNKAIYCTRSKDVGMMGREVDVCDCTSMGMEDMLYR